MRICIVGAGLVGLYLAWKLSNKGEVVVFEKKCSVSGKPCSFLVSESINNFFAIKKEWIKNEIQSCKINFPKKSVELIFSQKHLVLDRENVEKELLELGKTAGVNFCFTEEVKEIPKNFDRIIGCDGADSSIRKLLKLKSPKFRLGIQFFLPIKDCSSFVEVWPIKNGFIWKIPRCENVEYGAIGNIYCVANELINFCKKNCIEFKMQNLKAAIIPQGLIIPKLLDITLCGDAAGLTKPWSGGGVIWGLTAANILIETFPNFIEYRKRAIKFFKPKILKGNILETLFNFVIKYSYFLLPSKILWDNDFGKIYI